jgi:hypothetical protein
LDVGQGKWPQAGSTLLSVQGGNLVPTLILSLIRLFWGLASVI